MNGKRQFLFLYLGLVIGTILFNIGVLKGVNTVVYQGNIEEYLRLLLIRSIEMLVILLIADRLYVIWDIISGFMAGFLLGYLLSAHAVSENIWNQFMYSIVELVIVMFYMEIFCLNGIPCGFINLTANKILHNSVIRYILVVTILLINSFLELKIVKIF